MAEGNPPQTPDLAVRAFIGLFVLGAVLHGFDVMKDGFKSTVTWWIVGGSLALIDWYWIRIKNWLGPRFAITANNVATDFRWWALALVAVFAAVAGSDIYRAATGTKDVSHTTAPLSYIQRMGLVDVAASLPLLWQEERIYDAAINNKQLILITATPENVEFGKYFNSVLSAAETYMQKEQPDRMKMVEPLLLHPPMMQTYCRPYYLCRIFLV